MSALVSFLFLSFLLFFADTMLEEVTLVAGFGAEPLVATGMGLLDVCSCCCDNRRRSMRTQSVIFVII